MSSVAEGLSLKKVPFWFASIFAVFSISAAFLPTTAMAMALAGLAAAVIGTILYGEERLPFVVGGLALLIAGGVTDFEALIHGMEWVLFIKLVGLLTWVDYLNTTGYFDHLIEKYLPRQLQGYTLMAVLLILASFSAALIDEVNSIVLWYAVVRAIIGFSKKGKFLLKPTTWTVLVILLVSATNIGSQFLPLGNPVGIAISVLSGLSAVDFIKMAWVPGLITLAYFLIRVRMNFGGIIQEFSSVAVEQEDFDALEKQHERFEMVEHEDPIEDSEVHEVSHSKKVPVPLLHALFGLGILGLVVSEPLGSMFHLHHGTGLGLFVLLLFAVTMFIAGVFGEHNEVVLSELPLTTLFFIVFLFGIAHGLEITGLTELAADEIFHTVGQNQILIRLIIVVVGAFVTAFMDNVIAIAVLAPIIAALGDKGVETVGLWFTLLAVAVVAGNLTPIGSAANIIANARIRAGWGIWVKNAGLLAIECLIVNVVILYFWEQFLRGAGLL